ncbi:hypothetical protein H2O73_03800 [Vibrio sp. 404]|uniref:Beta/gamma crystallin 'Greek key' domain-containing protein n=1 Tax=Vibrio marinisediminis TaxID=2758441 RepID=A0A7W2FNP4_9VIBR|nr:beta/gamma crystallin-related protein [Vibrio marinisediminis]MBA5761459.1 hypothetical protein [Vibrio marinisediminis]
MLTKLKFIICSIFIGLSISPFTFAQEITYICTLKPFTDTFVEAGRSEKSAKRNVREQCENSYGEGSMFCRSKDATCKVSNSYQDSHSKITNQGAVIYQNRQMTGRYLFIENDIPDLNVFKFDNQLRSFSIPRGWRVRFYVGTNYTGDYYTRDGGSQNADGFEGVISSIRIISR